ncbi:MAG: hypothetical protein K8R46_04780 [Pirellulales bacterium]|nr:hypothetical protein [Pirellulales bacterium]
MPVRVQAPNALVWQGFFTPDQKSIQSTSLQISWFDLSLVFVYPIAVVAIGCYAGHWASIRRRRLASGEYTGGKRAKPSRPRDI